MNNVFIKLLMSIANQRNMVRNNKTLLVDGIEYVVYMDSGHFSLEPVNEELQEMARYLIVPFDNEKAWEWHNKRKSIRPLVWDWEKDEEC